MNQNEFHKRYRRARRKAISLDFGHLNDAQLSAVLTTEGPLLLLAGAGSGKTAVLINRIANLIKYGNGSDSEYVPDYIGEDDLRFLEEYCLNFSEGNFADKVRELCAVDPVEPWRIIAITFTNKAAGEMKERLEQMLGAEAAGDIKASTFHSACVRFLRRDIDRLGYDPDFTIYDTTDSVSLIKGILKEQELLDSAFPPKTILGYISRAKDAMQSAEDFLTETEKTFDTRRKIVANIYVEYEKRMKASNALDFDDLIFLTVRLFMEHPDVLRHYQRRFKHVLIDEYQDTNNLQYLLASSLAGGYGNICVVGDDDQSIYKFRGATIENILNFEEQFPSTKVIRLEQNYRSTGLILSAAGDVIRNNQGRKGKKLWTDKDPGEKPSLHVVSDERAEAQLVADTIIAAIAEQGKWSQHAILYRMNAQSNQFETAFKRSGIPYRIYGGIGFFERAEIKDMLAYLCVIHNPHDNVRLLRIINNPTRGIGQTTISRLTELASQYGRSVFEMIKESHNHEILKNAAGKLHGFADMIDEFRALVDSVPLDELYDAVIDQTGYVRALEDKNVHENVSRIENVRELKTNIISFMKNSDDVSLFGFLSETALFTDLDRDDDSTDRVMLMTMHSAKGLEFDTVFLVGAEDGVFPSSRAIGDFSEMEEERRLCYVAMTRAERLLYFTSARQRMLFGKTTAAQTSRFVREIDSENIQTHDSSFSFGNSDFFSPPYSDESQIFDSAHGHSFSSSRNTTSEFSGGQRFSQSKVQQSRPKPAKPAHDYKVGDAIEHTAFGKGVITELTPAGNDALLAIDFDNGETKKFLLNTAARNMTKV